MTQPNEPTGSTPPPPGSTPPPTVDYSAGGSGYPGPYSGPTPDKDAMTMGMLCHLLGIFTAWLGPLIIWLMKKDQSPFVDDQGKETLNFQIMCFIGYIICAPLAPLFCLGVLLALAITIVRIILGIMGTIAANKGTPYRYPVNLRLIK